MTLLLADLLCCLRSTQNATMAPRPVLRNIQGVLQREMVREFLAETMSTYVMMVSVCVWRRQQRQFSNLSTPGVIAVLPLPLRWELGKEAEESREAFLIIESFGDRKGLMMDQDRVDEGGRRTYSDEIERQGTRVCVCSASIWEPEAQGLRQI